MDRSYLSDSDVVAASRNFVCLRLATYEDQAEADFMKSVYIGRNGDLANTTFALLSPDGEKSLVTAGRGPFHAFRSASSMSASLAQLADDYPRRAGAAEHCPSLPLMKTVDLALNVAACDGLPLLVVVGETSEAAEKIQRDLAVVAWQEPLAGQFIYGSASDKRTLKPIAKARLHSALLIVEPDPFGLTGKIFRAIDPNQPSAVLKEKLVQAITAYPHPLKDHNRHVRLGIRLGIEWETVIPETDQQSLRAKARARGK